MKSESTSWNSTSCTFLSSDSFTILDIDGNRAKITISPENITNQQVILPRNSNDADAVRTARLHHLQSIALELLLVHM